jgi:hypothetical protein
MFDRQTQGRVFSALWRVGGTLVLLSVLACGSGTSTVARDSGAPPDSDSGADSGPLTACAEVAAALCPLLRTCPVTPGGGTCEASYQFPTITANLGTNCGDCETEFETSFTRQCDPTTDFAPCIAALNAGKATCGISPSATAKSLQLPSDCSGLLECGGKPGVCK